MRRKQRGVTIAELLVFSGLSLLITGLIAKVLVDYRGLSLVFDQRTRVTTSANIFFTKLRESFELSSNKGVNFESSKRAIVIQKLDGANGRSSQSWQDELLFVWMDEGQKQIHESSRPAASFDPGFQSGDLVTVNSEIVIKGLADLQAVKNKAILLQDVEEFEISRPSPGEAIVSVKIQKKSYRNKVETIERKQSFSLLIDEDF